MSTSWRLEAGLDKPTHQHPIAFIALTLLVGRQEDNLACKNWAMGYWHDYLSEASCK